MNTLTQNETLSQAELTALVEELRKSQADLENRRFVETTIARFTPLLRWQIDDSLENWVNRIIEELAVSVRGLQACLYVTNEETVSNLANGYSKIENQTLQLAGAYALNKDKVQKNIPFGDGILGQAAASARAQHFTNLGLDFEGNSATGLVSLHPRSLVIQPLIYNDHVEGVLEISSLYDFSPQELEVIRSLSENVAASLMTVRNQEQMKKLYREASQKSEELQAQEEEMRQNMEEMQATQEEMRRIQEALKATQINSSALINNTTDLIMLLSADLRFLLANESMKYILASTGKGGELVFGKTELSEYMEPAEFEKLKTRYLQVVETGTPQTFTDTFKDVQPGADEMTFEIRLYPVFDEQGKVYGIASFSRDVSEEKRKEKAIYEAAERNRALFEVSRDAMFVFSDGVFAEANPAALTIFACNSYQDIIGKTPMDFSPAFQSDGRTSEEAATDYIGQALQRGFKDFEWTHKRLNGETFDAEVRIVCYQFQGKPVLQSTIRDITDEKAIEREREESQVRFQRQEKGLSRLAGSEILSGGDIDRAFEEITQTLSNSLGVGQAGVWFYNNEADMIISGKVFQQADQSYSEGMILYASEYPNYFKSLQTEAILAVSDVLTDERTLEFKDYFKQYHIGAMLDVPIRRNGRMIGVVCCEHIGESRQWQPDEERFAASVAEMVALALEAADRKLAAEQLELNEKELKAALHDIQQKNEEMYAQQEELRQNLEELEATQEDLVSSREALAKLQAEEKLRIQELMENQKNLMTKANDRFKKSLAAKDAEIETLKAQLDKFVKKTDKKVDKVLN